MAVFQTIAPKFSDCPPLAFELIAADVSGDLAYTVGYEHSAVSIGGGPVVRNDLHVTHIYRREDGVWRSCIAMAAVRRAPSKAPARWALGPSRRRTAEMATDSEVMVGAQHGVAVGVTP